MKTQTKTLLSAGAILSTASVASADTEPYFIPLTESAPVTTPNSDEELNAPWVVPAGISQENLTSLQEAEGDPSQSVGRAEGAGTSASMFDMSAYDATGRYVFIPHESPYSAGLSRYDMVKDEIELLWKGDGQGAEGDWSHDYGAFDPATFTPNCTVMVAEEWTGEGRIMETMNPYASPDQIEVRELDSVANVAHEGLRFSLDGRVLYFVDEWNSGSIYKFVTAKKGDYTKGQTFVLSVDDFAGNAADYWNEDSNADAARTGAATWIPLTDATGTPLTSVSPFRNGPTNDPRDSDDTRGGRVAADEVGATPYGRPEDMEISTLANGSEVLYFTATSEQSVYSIELNVGGDDDKAMVRLFVGPETLTNVGFEPTTGSLNSPDNLAQDALGNIFVIEDAPNGSSTGGDIWFARDVDDDGVAESLDHFMSIRVDGSEATGMIFSPVHPLEFVVNVQHPDSTDLGEVPGGFGDAMWKFTIGKTGSKRLVKRLAWAGKLKALKEFRQILECYKAQVKQTRPSKGKGRRAAR